MVFSFVFVFFKLHEASILHVLLPWNNLTVARRTEFLGKLGGYRKVCHIFYDECQSFVFPIKIRQALKIVKIVEKLIGPNICKQIEKTQYTLKF